MRYDLWLLSNGAAIVRGPSRLAVLTKSLLGSCSLRKELIVDACCLHHHVGFLCMSDLDLLCALDGVIDLDAEVANGALDLCVPE
jgi:hypothetical protein